MGECFLGGHIWWRPSAQGEASASWSWPGVAPSLQRWRGQRPTSLHILNAVLNGQDGLVFLSSSGLNEQSLPSQMCPLSLVAGVVSPSHSSSALRAAALPQRVCTPALLVPGALRML